MKWAMYSVSSLALLAICNQALAADGNINITGNQNSIYIASDNVSGSSFDNLSITSSTATFKKDLIGTQNKNVTNQTLSFSGKTAEGNIIGLSRVRNGANIAQKNTINISGGVVEGDVLATSDKGNYNGTERRSHNLVNISGGTFGGNIEGGAGADNNVITITGGTFKASNNNNTLSDGDDGDDGDCGGQGIGTIYAGVSDPNTKNKSNNATVTLKNLNNTNSFITSFVEGNNNQSGIIFGSNITGMSQLQFNNVNATYNGGFKDFDHVDIDVTSQVALNGKSYYADIWKVSGTLNTNGKTIHSYKNSTLELNVADTGNVTQQFISDANVDAMNQGNINGISTNKNIALNNSGNMSGNYSGATVNITNSGNINNSTGQSTSISSQNPGVLTNTGQINGSLTLNHGMSINNNAGGNIVNAQIKNGQNELNINNNGTIHASEFINQGNRTINLTNNTNGVISESLSLTNGTLNLDNNGGTLTDNQFSSNAGIFNINNSGTINGNTSLSASNGGSMSLANQANGLVTGSLEIVSGLSNFENNGLFQDLNITNQQSGLALNNNGQINGNGSIKSNNPFSLNNNAGGEISGNQSWQNVALNNANGATVENLNLTADDGTVTIENQGEISGSNVLNSTNGGSMSLANQVDGLVTGSLEIVSGLSNFENNGLFQDLNITNQQSGLVLNNNGQIQGNGSIKSNNPFSLNNSSGGEISGNQSWQNVALNNANGATVENLNLTADDGTVTIENQGEISGSNVLNSTNGGSMSLANQVDGLVTGSLEIVFGLSNFENNGLFQDLNITNQQSGLVLNNNGQIQGNGSIKSNNPFSLNNSSGGEISGNQSWQNVALNNSGNVTDLNLTADDGTVTIENQGEISGSNVLNSTNGGSMSLANQVDGLVTGSLEIVSGLSNFENNGLFQDLNITNQQSGLALNNNGQINGNGSIKSNSLFSLDNSSGGEISGNQSWQNVALSNSGNVTDLSLTADNGTVTIENQGEISGSNVLNSTNGGSMSLANQVDGLVTGSLEIVSGLSNFENNGLFQDLNITNQQSGLALNNNGQINGNGSIKSNNPFSLNNSSGGEISGNQSWQNVALNNSGNVTDLSLTADDGTVTIENQGEISGSNVLNSANGGSMSLANQVDGLVTGSLEIVSGLSNFENNGLFQDLNITNQQSGLALNNNGQVNGNGSIKSNNPFSLNNNAGGEISGNQSWQNVALNNSGNVTDLNLTADDGTVTIENQGEISGSNVLNSANGGSMSLANQANGLVTGSLEIVSGLSNFENNGLFQDLNITNQQSGLVLNNNGQVSNVSFNNNDGNLDIQNSGEFSGITNFAVSDNSAITLSNTETGNISGQFVVNGGLASLENLGNISNWQLASNISAFTINNDGTLSGNNELVSEGEITFNNSAEVSGNLFLNSARTIINNNSADWDNNIIGTAGDGNLDFTNASDGTSITTLSGNFNDLSLQNNNTDITASQFSLDNSANINGQIELGNEGYMGFTNNNNLAADISDNLILADSDTNLETRFDLTNNAQISGNISVMNSALHLTNQTGAEITSNHIDTRELYLANSGKFENTSDYTFSVQDYINFDNSGVINGGDMVLKLSGDDVRGQITNSGTMWSYGTTIGMGDVLTSCPNCSYSEGLDLYNTGLVIAVDPTDFTIPRLDSYAINAPSMNVYNQNAGVIGGSMNVNNYTQESGTTWVTFMDKDKSVMSTITAQNEVTIEPGAVLFVNTNNDTTAFTDGQQFKLVTALGMEEDEIKTQLDNYILQTDTPFATYSMMNDGTDGYIVFNKVAPSNFASSTDLTTSNHNNIVAGAHRVYELFVNRNMKSSLPNGMSSGDEIEKHTHLAFMPVVGHARQKEDINHSGYRSDYHGGIGYIEHNFTPTIKGGLGFAYLQNNTDYTDEHGSYSNSDTYRPFAYINYTNDNWRVDVAAGTAKHKIRNNRKYSFNDNVYMAKSKYDSDEISAHVSAGYRFHLSDSFMLQPMAGLFAAHVKTDTYEETGNGPMNMHISSEDYTSFKSMLGLKIKKEYKLSESFRLKPEMHLRWYHELGDTNGAVSAYFLAQQELFNANGADAPRDIGDIALRLTTERNDNLDLFVEGFYQFGQDFYNLGGTIGIKYNF